MMADSLIITMPDDFHHHLRDGDALASVVLHASRSFSRVIAMPNLKPPIRNVAEALQYKQRIQAQVPEIAKDFNAMMTLYLTDATSCEDIEAGVESGIIHACKLYPAGATTNSEYGVTDIGKISLVLQKMSDLGLPLLVHGEVVDPQVDMFDREKVCIDTVLRDLVAAFPNLKLVMEHITTADAVEFVESSGPNVVATITAHHLLYNRSDIFKGGICPHMYCLPILKRERHRLALLAAATSGNPKFFIGTDSAPHAVGAKESACGCAGVYTAHAAVELYAEAFDSVGALDKLQGFCSEFGQRFYGLEMNTKKIRLVREAWQVPSTYGFGETVVRPLRAGEAILWTVQPVEGEGGGDASAESSLPSGDGAAAQSH